MRAWTFAIGSFAYIRRWRPCPMLQRTALIPGPDGRPCNHQYLPRLPYGRRSEFCTPEPEAATARSNPPNRPHTVSHARLNPSDRHARTNPTNRSRAGSQGRPARARPNPRPQRQERTRQITPRGQPCTFEPKRPACTIEPGQAALHVRTRRTAAYIRTQAARVDDPSRRAAAHVRTQAAALPA